MAFQITGITRDNVGNIAGSCDVYLLKYASGTHLFTQIARVVSDASTGVFLFSGIADNDPSYNIVAFKDGSPDIFDVSDRNIVPQFVSAGTAFNVNDKSAEVTLSNNNLTMAVTTNGGAVRSTTSHTTGKYYVEFTMDAHTQGNGAWIGLIGFALSGATLGAALDSPSSSFGIRLRVSVEHVNTGDGLAADLLNDSYSYGFCIDIDNGRWWWRCNDPSESLPDHWQGSWTTAESVDAGAHMATTIPSFFGSPVFFYTQGLANGNTCQITVRCDGTTSGGGVGWTVPTGYGNAW